jgi:2-polyprenyl-3-methyl-5-hydroxy-6-metoxy-1,4-benzoquinol methylase
VGVDLDTEGVRWAQDAGLTAASADCTDADQVASLGLDPADLVIAGELIEHVDNAGAFLDAIRSLVGTDGKLVLTTPNCYSMSGFLAGLIGYEMTHPDHVAVYSYFTLRALLARHEWCVTETYTYGVTSLVEKRDRQLTRRALHAMLKGVLKAEHFVARWRPFVADGLIVVCQPESATND